MKAVLFVLPLFLIISCTSPAHKDTSDSTSSAAAKTYAGVGSQTWTFTKTPKSMSADTDYQAAISAANQLQFKEPYEGGSSAILAVRHLDGKNRLTLTITKGRFVSNNPDGEKVKIKFDDSKAAVYNCDPGRDDDADMLYIHPANNLIQKLNNTKKVIIEAEFLNEGTKQLSFNVAGLKWNHRSVYMKD